MAEANGNKRGLDSEELSSKRPRLDNEQTQPSDPSQQEQEIAVGITAFVSPECPGFDCILKQRYTDFLVNEITPDGEVLHLKELPETSRKGREDAPPSATNDLGDQGEETITDSTTTKDAPVEESPSEVEKPEISLEDMAELRSIFGESITEKFIRLYTAVLAHPGKKPRDQPNFNTEVISEKSQRTQAHLAVRRIFNSRLETATSQDEPGVIAVRAAQTKGASGVRSQANGRANQNSRTKGRVGWDELGGEYLHFTLYKENKDTMEVLYFMASQFKLNIKNFQFAGTKDRRGVTVQRVSLFRVQADRLINLNRLAKGWVASDFEYKKHGLELGELLGNEFHLTLRDCRVRSQDGSEMAERLEHVRAAVATAAESFQKRGFLNYYGLQRFGTFSTGTHVIGMKMLKGDLEGAIDSILTYDPKILEETSADAKIPHENIERAQAIKTWRETGEVPRNMPRRFQAEASIMEYLSRRDRKTKHLIQGRDWQGALMQIQRNLRLMYVHAYQSLVWNTVAGHRWKIYGETVVPGDLVIVGEKDDAIKGPKEEVDDDGEPVFHPAAHDSAVSAADDFVRARPLSEAEAASGKYDIFDIVLPLPGFDVIYPPNEIGKFYEDFMNSEAGGGLDPHQMRRSWKDVSLSGGYRKVLARPGKGFEARVVECSDPLQQLVETDAERLSTKPVDATMEAPHEGEHKHSIAIVMKLALGSSQYATMALRELTKGGASNFRPDFSAPR